MGNNYDVIKKDAEKLGELINELSQHSKFTEKAAEINTLMDSYFNNEYIFICVDIKMNINDIELICWKELRQKEI